MPERTKLTRPKVAALAPPERGDRIVYDADERNLGVRVTSRGHKTFVLYRRVGGKPTKLLVAEVDDLTVEEARRVARSMSEAIDDGHPPALARRFAHLLRGLLEEGRSHEDARRVALLAAEREASGATAEEARAYAVRVSGLVAGGRKLDEARREVEGSETLRAVFARYLEEHAKLKKRSWRDDEGLFKRYMQPIADLPLDAITVERVRGLHSEVGKRAPGGANRMRSLLSKVFSFARGRNAPNPCRDVQPFPETERTRRLTPNELRRFLVALDAHHDTDPADVLRVLLWTGQRKGNVLAMRWADIDLDSGTWTIPGEFFKNKQPHTASLPGVVVTLLRKRQRRGEYVFRGRGGKGHREDVERPWRAILAAAGIDKSTIRLHDLRATFGTLMAENGETLEAIARQMGHRSLATTKRYMRLDQSAVKSAVSRTAAAIEKIAQGGVAA